MNVRKTLNDRISAVVIVFTIAVVALAILYSVIDYVFARGVEQDRVFLEMPDPKYTECVRDTEYMRFHHWELLSEMRDESVRYGKRGVEGFDDCRVCHANRAGFCNRCHEAVNLEPDCWGCHYYPETPEEGDARLNLRMREKVSGVAVAEGEEGDG